MVTEANPPEGRGGRIGKKAEKMLESETWREQASCKGANPEEFFPERGSWQGGHKTVHQYCAGCPVRQQCLDYSFTNHLFNGIWGGLSEKARQRLRKHGYVVTTTCVECGNVYGYPAGDKSRLRVCSQSCRRIHRNRQQNQTRTTRQKVSNP